jgi:hypothetical protein
MRTVDVNGGAGAAAGLSRAQLKALHWHIYRQCWRYVRDRAYAVSAGRIPACRAADAIALLALVQLGFLGHNGVARRAVALSLGGLLLLFCSFNVLEASQPSLVSRHSPMPPAGALRWGWLTPRSRFDLVPAVRSVGRCWWGGAQGCLWRTLPCRWSGWSWPGV